jgi:hypothetical protein
MPRKKAQNKIEITKSLEKYNTTLNNNNNIDSLNTNTNLHNDDNINTIINNNIDTIIDENKINSKSKSLDTYFCNNNTTQLSPLSTSPILTSSISNKIHNNNIISSSESDDDENELVSIDTILSLIEIKNRIDNLHENEFVEIFKIIKSNNEKFTTNSNGIFINICNLKTVSINEITKFLIFSENNNKLIKKEEKERKIYRECVS